jgi:outer membrane protein TolC
MNATQQVDRAVSCSTLKSGGEAAFIDIGASRTGISGAADPPRVRLLLAISFLSFAQLAGGVTLDAVLDTTLEKNPVIQQAKANVEQAAGQRLVLRSIMWPDAKIALPGGVQGGHRAGEESTKLFGFARGFFSQALFNAAIPPARRLGDINLLIAQQQLNVAVVQQLHGARVAFYTALYNRELESIGADQQQRLDQNVASQQSRYEAGLTNRSAFVDATVQARELASRIETSQRAYGAAQLKLAEAMGQNFGAEAPLPEPDGQLQFAPLTVDLKSETARAVSERADLKLAHLFVRAANEQQRIIEAGYYPAVVGTVVGDYVPVTGIHREGSTRRTDDFTGSEVREGAAYTWRVIDNGKVTGAVIRQRATREMNELTCRRLEANVGRELSRIQIELGAIEEREKSLAAATGAAEESARVVAQNLAGGLASQLEYRLTQNGFLQTKSGLLTAIYEHNLARAEWDRATGRYFQFSDPPSPKATARQADH